MIIIFWDAFSTKQWMVNSGILLELNYIAINSG